ncbi:MAG: 4Fe-4S dicluster domain-containing protein [Thermoleophilia bacterium]|nr:4Fe-4S dicluster domain-containing protein [Thermoleophilia bacterium]
MAAKFLKREDLPAFLASLAQSGRVIAPVKTNGLVQFEPWTPDKQVELEVLLAKQSPKEWVFPQTEKYLEFKYGKVMPEAAAAPAGGAAGVEDTASTEDAAGAPSAAVPLPTVEVQVLNEAPAQVIFGLRPCDARGFVQMDQVFGGYGGFYFDPFYNARRAATTLLVVACAEPRSTCFCTAVGGCPAGREGADAIFIPVEGGFLVDTLTEKGEAATSKFSGLSEASDAQKVQAAEVEAQAITKVAAPFALEGLRDRLHDNIDDPRWRELCMRCISCGTCTYVCPSCYCFSINDELVESCGERYRVWDNCFNPIYTEETSGHNPRAEKFKRFRNRFSHKFWYYPDKYDSLLCSGCGRCIMHCPTRIDIREVLRVMGAAPEVAEAAAGAPAQAEGKEA